MAHSSGKIDRLRGGSALREQLPEQTWLEDLDSTLVLLRGFLYTMDRHPAALGGTAIPLPAKGGIHNGLDYRSWSYCSCGRVARWHLQPAHPQAHHEGRSLVGHGRPAEAPLCPHPEPCRDG